MLEICRRCICGTWWAAAREVSWGSFPTSASSRSISPSGRARCASSCPSSHPPSSSPSSITERRVRCPLLLCLWWRQQSNTIICGLWGALSRSRQILRRKLTASLESRQWELHTAVRCYMSDFIFLTVSPGLMMLSVVLVLLMLM